MAPRGITNRRRRRTAHGRRPARRPSRRRWAGCTRAGGGEERRPSGSAHATSLVPALSGRLCRCCGGWPRAAAAPARTSPRCLLSAARTSSPMALSAVSASGSATTPRRTRLLATFSASSFDSRAFRRFASPSESSRRRPNALPSSRSCGQRRTRRRLHCLTRRRWRLSTLRRRRAARRRGRRACASLPIGGSGRSIESRGCTFTVRYCWSGGSFGQCSLTNIWMIRPLSLS